MGTNRESDVRALMRLLTYAKMGAARLGLWDAVQEISESVQLVAGEDDSLSGVLESECDALINQAAESVPAFEGKT